VITVIPGPDHQLGPQLQLTAIPVGMAKAIGPTDPGNPMTNLMTGKPQRKILSHPRESRRQKFQPVKQKLAHPPETGPDPIGEEDPQKIPQSPVKNPRLPSQTVSSPVAIPIPTPIQKPLQMAPAKVAREKEAKAGKESASGPPEILLPMSEF
jgi:hypothetical protein